MELTGTGSGLDKLDYVKLVVGYSEIICFPVGSRIVYEATNLNYTI